jgi:hypothetical protein
MLRYLPHIMVCSTLSLAACSSIRDANRNLFVGLVAAEPLDHDFAIPEIPAVDPKPGVPGRAAVPAATWTLTGVTPDDTPTYLSLVLFDSIGKCKRLIDSQGILSRAIDVEFDSISTILTALATAFTPLATVHALTAAAAISSGTKANLDTDLYHQKTSDIIATQIDSTYFANLNAYVGGLATTIGDKKAISAPIEFIKIALIHRQCSIDLALGALAAKAKTPDASTLTKPIGAADLKAGAAVPGSYLPGWIVVKTTDKTVIIKNGDKGSTVTLPLDTFLVLLNAKSGAIAP